MRQRWRKGQCKNNNAEENGTRKIPILTRKAQHIPSARARRSGER